MHTVTSAPPAARDDHEQRFKRYAVSMLIRTVCFVAAVGAFLGPGWPVVGVVLLVLASVLPAVAVVIANATNRTRLQGMGSVVAPEPPPLSRPHLPHRPHRHTA